MCFKNTKTWDQNYTRFQVWKLKFWLLLLQLIKSISGRRILRMSVRKWIQMTWYCTSQIERNNHYPSSIEYQPAPAQWAVGANFHAFQSGTFWFVTESSGTSFQLLWAPATARKAQHSAITEKCMNFIQTHTSSNLQLQTLCSYMVIFWLYRQVRLGLD